MSHTKKHDHKNDHGEKKSGIHKDWRAWVAVILMLVAMAAYVFSDSEELSPEGEQPAIEAAE